MFDWYVGLLAFSGIAMIVMANVKSGQGEFARVLNAVFGIGFLGYAAYLAFYFDGGSYLIFFQAFILPVLLAINFMKSTNWSALTTRPTPTQQAWRAYQREQQRG